MIQRIQSLFLLAAATCTALTYKFSFFSGNKTRIDNKPPFEKLTASSNFLLIITTAILIAGCIYIIFLYKKRKQQMWLTVAAAAVSVINLFLFFNETKKFLPGQGNYDLTAILPLAVPVLLILAVRSIWNDEKLVKSVDRLR